MSKKVIIIGGGAAGLSAGVKLAERGHQVELFEARSFLGGRLYSFVEPVTGDIVDNGQHLMAGFYYNTFKLLTMLGTAHLVSLQNKLEIEFLEKGPKAYWFRCASVPMPLGFLWGLMRYSRFPKGDILRLGKNSLKLKKEPAEDQTASQWLDGLGISDSGIYTFFRPLIFATLNADIDQVSAKVFQKMLSTILDAKSRDAVLAFPGAGLSKIVADPAGEYISKNGGTINLCTQIKEILVDSDRVNGIVDVNGNIYSADAYICALPPDDLCGVIPEGENHYLKEWNYSPIVAVHIS